MTIDWQKARWFVHRRALFCTAAVLEGGEIRLFPIGSLRLDHDGRAVYFEIFARPVTEGSSITFLAVDINPLFWLVSLLKGSFAHPPALRLRGTLGPRRASSEHEKKRFLRRLGWLLRTKGGKMLWSRPERVREVNFRQAEPVRIAGMTRHLKDWLAGDPTAVTAGITPCAENVYR